MIALKSAKLRRSILERFMLDNPNWQEGYRSFNQLFGRPLGWCFIINDAGANRLIRLDRKDYCSFYAASATNQKSIEAFITKYCELYAQNLENLERFSFFFKDAFGKLCAIFSISHHMSAASRKTHARVSSSLSSSSS